MGAAPHMDEYWQVEVVADDPSAGRLADRPLGQLLVDLTTVGWTGSVTIRSDRTLNIAVVSSGVGVYGHGAGTEDVLAAFAWSEGQFVLKPGAAGSDRVEGLIPVAELVARGLMEKASTDLIRDRLLRVAEHYPVATPALTSGAGPSPHLMAMLARRCTGRASVQEVCGRNCAFGRILCLALDLRWAVLSDSQRTTLATIHTARHLSPAPTRPVTLDVPALGGSPPRLAVASYPESVSFLPATSETLPRFADAVGDATPLPAGDDQRAALRFYQLGKELAARGRLERAFDAFAKAAELEPDNPNYARLRDELHHLMR